MELTIDNSQSEGSRTFSSHFTMILKPKCGLGHSVTNAKVYVSGYIGCTKNAMLCFFLHSTHTLSVNKTLTLHRDNRSSPSCYYFVQDDIKVEISDSDVMTFLSTIGQHVLA